jgi:mitochondrial enoyl-[acyl-carrier protein] reductase / trans-2-enoyl-CoA reductase
MEPSSCRIRPRRRTRNNVRTVTLPRTNAMMKKIAVLSSSRLAAAAAAARRPTLRGTARPRRHEPSRTISSLAGRWLQPRRQPPQQARQHLHPRKNSKHNHDCRWYHELAYERTGPVVTDVVRYRRSDSNSDSTPFLDDAKASDGTTQPMVQVKMLCAPWNPADMNAIQGLYPLPQSSEVQKIRTSNRFQGEGGNDGGGGGGSSSSNFTVAGSEGLGRVSHVSSSSSSSVRVGDYVTLAYPSLGTMRSSLVVPEHMLVKVDRGRELVQRGASISTNDGETGSSSTDTTTTTSAAAASASCLFQMGGTALRMLSDFVPIVGPGSPAASSGIIPKVVLQNAGNSAVGIMASQIAALHGARAVSLVRRGNRTPQQLDDLVEHLMTVGRNEMVVLEDDLHQDREAVRRLKDQLRQLSGSDDDDALPLLALNAVGGSSCSLLLKLVGEGATLVTYGGMSRKPVPVSTAQLIFGDVQVRGYWQSRWMSHQPHSAKHRLVNDLVDLVLDRGLQCPPVHVFPLRDFERAMQFEADQSGASVRHKVVFDCQQHDEEEKEEAA